jgi:ANTAR domain-containing protein
MEAELETLRLQVEQLTTALESRIVIEQAKGILRERLGCSIDDAFAILRYGARSSRTNIHELAARVVADRTTPGPIAVAIARSSRWKAASMRERAEAQRAHAEELDAAIREQQEHLAWLEARSAGAARGRAYPAGTKRSSVSQRKAAANAAPAIDAGRAGPSARSKKLRPAGATRTST